MYDAILGPAITSIMEQGRLNFKVIISLVKTSVHLRGVYSSLSVKIILTLIGYLKMLIRR